MERTGKIGPPFTKTLGFTRAAVPADYRYVKNEAAYLPIAESALADRFNAGNDFHSFYAAIGTPERKNLFLRTTSFYYYLIKKGDWVVSAPDCDPVIDYFTNSYKTVGLFALIESLSDDSHEDFHAWLTSDARAPIFPVASPKQLSDLHSEYKATFGSIRRCVTFFGRLPQDRQKELCGAVRMDRKPMASIKTLAEYLYDIRSKFVHQADLVLQMSGSTYHLGHKKLIHTQLTMPLLCAAFEEGLVAYFSET